MEIYNTSIAGLVILEPRVFQDERGAFFESYNEEIFARFGIVEKFVQDNQSVSHKGVIRGLHFQKPPFAQGKLVRVIQGAVQDVAVDIRPDSPTYGKWEMVELSAENHRMFYIPPGFAHGFVALEDHTIFAYKCTNVYNKEAEGSIRYNDPRLQIPWNTDMPLVSSKDIEAPLLETLAPIQWT